MSAARCCRAQGQHEQAEAAFTEASATGFEPQPGLALLWVEQGQGDSARLRR